MSKISENWSQYLKALLAKYQFHCQSEMKMFGPKEAVQSHVQVWSDKVTYVQIRLELAGAEAGGITVFDQAGKPLIGYPFKTTSSLEVFEQLLNEIIDLSIDQSKKKK